MPISKEKKKEVIDKVSDALKSSKSVVFVNFHGLTMVNTTELRRKLRAEGIGYTVAKKTLAKRALDTAAINGEVPVLDGELALAYGTDLIAPAREIYGFQKKFDNKLSIIGGIFEGRYMTKEEMTEIAAIPPQLVLYGQLVNLINSPIQGLVLSLNAIAGKKE